eukprot:3308815-Rhodomonas_salina.1
MERLNVDAVPPLCRRRTHGCVEGLDIDAAAPVRGVGAVVGHRVSVLCVSLCAVFCACLLPVLGSGLSLVVAYATLVPDSA